MILVGLLILLIYIDIPIASMENGIDPEPPVTEISPVITPVAESVPDEPIDEPIVEPSVDSMSFYESVQEPDEPVNKVYEGGAEVTYIDEDGSYHVFLCFDQNSIGLQMPNPITMIDVHEGITSAMPSQLAAYYTDTILTANDEFLEKIDRVSVQAIPTDQGWQMSTSVPDSDANFPYAALVSHISINDKCGNNTIQWTILMKNGDTILLEHDVYANKIVSSVAE